MNKKSIIDAYAADFLKTSYPDKYLASVLPFQALAKALGLRSFYCSTPEFRGFEFRTYSQSSIGFGRLVTRVAL
jgi:hypothetical protein